MTADFYPYEPAFLGPIAPRIVSEVKGINRIFNDDTSTPPEAIAWG